MSPQPFTDRAIGVCSRGAAAYRRGRCHAAGRPGPTKRFAMKLFYAPGACSIGIHVLLEEIGKPYALERST